MTLVIVQKIVQDLIIKLAVLKRLCNCIQWCVRITAECNKWKMFDFIFRNNIPWGWSHKVSRNKASNNMYSVLSLWRILLSRVHVASSKQGYLHQFHFIIFTKSCSRSYFYSHLSTRIAPSWYGKVWSWML